MRRNDPNQSIDFQWVRCNGDKFGVYVRMKINTIAYDTLYVPCKDYESAIALAASLEDAFIQYSCIDVVSDPLNEEWRVTDEGMIDRDRIL